MNPAAPRKHPDHTVDIAIVGGGPCGLAIALQASKRGFTVMLLESEPVLGGMLSSFRIAGQMVDYGSHRIHRAMPAKVESLLSELLGPDLQVRQRNGRLRLRNRWVSFPLQPKNLITNLPPSFVAASVRDVATKPFRSKADLSYADIISGGLGPTALADFHGPMAHKLWGVPASQLSGDLALKRVSVRSPTGLVRTIAKAAGPKGRTFLYPRLGIGQITDHMADAASLLGASLQTSTSVTGITDNQDCVRIQLQSGAVVSAKRVFWTARPDSLAGVLGIPSVPATNSRAMVFAYLVLPIGQYTSYDAHYVPDLDVVFSRLSEPRNYRDGPDPANQTVLCAEIPCDVGDDIWGADANSIEAMVVDGLGRIGLPTGPIAHTRLRRLASVYPLVTINDQQTLRQSPAWTENLAGITVLGRQGLGVADNLHHVIDMAQSAVSCIDSSGLWSKARWGQHLARFGDFIVED